MCGRYVLYGPQSRLTERFSLQACPDFASRYNIAPTSDVLVIRQRPEVGRVGQMVEAHVPQWREYRKMLRMAPLGHEEWGY